MRWMRWTLSAQARVGRAQVPVEAALACPWSQLWAAMGAGDSAAASFVSPVLAAPPASIRPSCHIRRRTRQSLQSDRPESDRRLRDLSQQYETRHFSRFRCCSVHLHARSCSRSRLRWQHPPHLLLLSSHFHPMPRRILHTTGAAGQAQTCRGGGDYASANCTTGEPANGGTRGFGQ